MRESVVKVLQSCYDETVPMAKFYFSKTVYFSENIWNFEINSKTFR